ncbi:ubiquitin-related modifier 1 [Panaeolus papilionaceus]|nr:ubiquitin-related modifier 1 [Panaeolus papilionaceus]
MSTLSIKIEFGGGLELLFANQRTYKIQIPSSVPKDNSTTTEALQDESKEKKKTDVTYLIHHMKEHMLKERAELFMENGTVRPGILVLINDTDWELEGEGDYELQDEDELVFISTLHGG